MYCPGCGTNNEIGARYCGVCGRALLAGAASGSTAQHPTASVDPAETSAGTTETTAGAQPVRMTAHVPATATSSATFRTTAGNTAATSAGTAPDIVSTAAGTAVTPASTSPDIVSTVVSIAMTVASVASDIAAIVASVAAGAVTAAAATRPGRMAADIVQEAISLLPGRIGAGTTTGTAGTATAGAVTAGAPGTRQPRQRYRIRMPSEARQAELAAKGIPIDYPLRSTWLTGIGVAITILSATLTSVCVDETTVDLFYGSIDMMIGLAIIQCLIIMMLKAYRVRVIPILWASIYVFYTFLLCIFMILQSNVWPLITFLASIAILVGCCLRN